MNIDYQEINHSLKPCGFSVCYASTYNNTTKLVKHLKRKRKIKENKTKRN